MKNLSPTQQACLDAMGIDVWVPRDVQNEDAIEAIQDTPILLSQVKQEQVPVTNAEILPVVENNQTIDVDASPIQKIADDIPTTLSIPDDWNGLSQAVSSCRECGLHTSRTHTVFGSGNQNADWLIIGDTPTVDDDKNGNPFTGQSGELLTAMLRAIKLTRQQVYITNTLKCTTPNNREPEESELDTCLQYLHKQISLINPKLILVLGQSAAQRVLNNQSTLARLRQKVHSLEDSNISVSVPVVVSYHPSSLLSMPANKGKAWQDLLFAQKAISSQAVL